MATKRRNQFTRKPSQKTRDEYTVVLEDIRDQFKAFGEAMDLVSEMLASHDKQLAKLDKLDVNIDVVKTELKLIRRDQVSRDEFDFLEKRVAKLEHKLAAR